MITITFYDFSTNNRFDLEYRDLYNARVFLTKNYYGKSLLYPFNFSFGDISNHAFYEYNEELNYWRSRIKQKLIKLGIYDLEKLYG